MNAPCVIDIRKFIGPQRGCRNVNKLFAEGCTLVNLYSLVVTVCSCKFIQNRYVVLFVQEEYREMGEFMSKGQADGWLRPVIGRQYPLDQAADAHVEVIEHSTTHKGKIVLNL